MGWAWSTVCERSTNASGSLDRSIRCCMCTYWEACSCRYRIHWRILLNVTQIKFITKTTTHSQTSTAVVGCPAIAALSSTYVGNIARDIIAWLCVHNSVSSRTVHLAYTRGQRASGRHIRKYTRAHALIVNVKFLDASKERSCWKKCRNDYMQPWSMRDWRCWQPCTMSHCTQYCSSTRLDCCNLLWDWHSQVHRWLMIAGQESIAQKIIDHICIAKICYIANFSLRIALFSNKLFAKNVLCYQITHELIFKFPFRLSRCSDVHERY